MDEQENFFSANHKRLLSIATWAKYLAWIVLIVYILLAGSRIIQYRDWQSIICEIPRIPGPDFINPPIFKLVMDMLSTILKGFIYFFTLKGVSLGLSMIVETDINYRKHNTEAVAK